MRELAGSSQRHCKKGTNHLKHSENGKVCSTRDGMLYDTLKKPNVSLRRCKHTVEIHNCLHTFGAAANGLLISMEEEDITLMRRITKKGEVIQTLDIKLALAEVVWRDELTASHCGTLDKRNLCACLIKVFQTEETCNRNKTKEWI